MRVGVGKRSNLARGIAIAAVTLSTGARAPGGNAWRPLAVGSRSVYDVALEESTDGRARPRRVHRVATLSETVAARGRAPGAEDAWYEVRIERRSASVGGASVRAATTWLSAEGGALREVARSGEGDTPLRHDEPLVWMPPGIAPGDRWRVGTLALAEGSIALEGTAAAAGPIETPAGRFADCLEVRYAGTYGIDGARAGATRGRFESREILARGVGPVRVVVARDLETEDDAGVRRARRLREVRTLRSRGTEAMRPMRERESRGETP